MFEIFVCICLGLLVVIEFATMCRVMNIEGTDQIHANNLLRETTHMISNRLDGIKEVLDRRLR